MIVLLILVSAFCPVAKEDSVCDDRWHDGSHLHMGCLLISKQTPFSTYSEAVAFCGRKNAHLVEIMTQEQLNFIREILKMVDKNGSSKSSNWWGGATEKEDGSWMWTRSNIPVLEFVWYQYKRTCDGNIGDCSFCLSESFEYYGGECHNDQHYGPVCQKYNTDSGITAATATSVTLIVGCSLGGFLLIVLSIVIVSRLGIGKCVPFLAPAVTEENEMYGVVEDHYQYEKDEYDTKIKENNEYYEDQDDYD